MNIFRNIQIGWFLASRQIRRGGIWSTLLIIIVMTLTFLNLVAVGGILVGLIEGSSQQERSHYSSDLIIKAGDDRSYITYTNNFLDFIKESPLVENYSVRYISSATFIANYHESQKPGLKKDEIRATIIGIDPRSENAVTGIKEFLLEGEFLTGQEDGEILIGTNLIEEYVGAAANGLPTLRDIHPGTKLLLKIDAEPRVVTVKGIIKSKVDNISSRIFMNTREVRALSSRFDMNAGEIAIDLKEGIPPEVMQNSLLSIDTRKENKIQTWQESQGKFFQDISKTFSILGDFTGSVGLIIASITVFIVIFINALNRKKYIGIMKALGINSFAIEFAYILQSLFYALLGIFFGLLILYGILVPYFDKNPIDFPFSDGILYAPLSLTLIRAGVLALITVIAGYIPARMIVSKPTINSILGR